MRDPRLLEIDILMDAETRKQLSIISTQDEAHSGVSIDDRRVLYGVNATTFRALVVDLLQRGYLTSHYTHMTLPQGADTSIMDAEREVLIIRLTQGQDVPVVISHAGRLRLWTLRDELLRNPDIEPLGLFSKAAWERAFPVHLQWASADEPLTVMFLDLDKFKAVNDTYGHRIGDAVLRAAFDIVKNQVGSRGTVYRYGGEEIGVLAPKLAAASAAELAEQLRAAIELGVRERVKELVQLDAPQTVSVGVSTFTERVAPEVAFDRVNALEKQAKELGRNRVVAG